MWTHTEPYGFGIVAILTLLKRADPSIGQCTGGGRNGASSALISSPNSPHRWRLRPESWRVFARTTNPKPVTLSQALCFNYKITYMRNLPNTTRISTAGDYAWAFNYSPRRQRLPVPGRTRFVIGGNPLEAHGVAVWKLAQQ